MNPTTASCLVCNAPLTPHQARVGKLCGSQVCRWKHQQLPKSQLCAGCGRPLASAQIPTRHCAAPECQRAFLTWLQVKKEEQRRKVEARREQARRLRDASAPAAGIREPGRYPLALIPAYREPIGELPRERRRAFRKHVKALVRRATAAEDPPPVEAPHDELSPGAARVLGQACARCQGYCCRGGENDAYLKDETIRRYRGAHPHLSAPQVFAAYVACVGRETYHGSCVFHTAGGCTLSREMRSDTCNQYFCDELKQFQREAAAADPVRGFFASVEADAVRGAFIDEDGAREAHE